MVTAAHEYSQPRVISALLISSDEIRSLTERDRVDRQGRGKSGQPELSLTERIATEKVATSRPYSPKSCSETYRYRSVPEQNFDHQRPESAPGLQPFSAKNGINLFLKRRPRSDMLNGIKVLQVGPAHYTDLVASQANFRKRLAALYGHDVGRAMGGGGYLQFQNTQLDDSPSRFMGIQKAYRTCACGFLP
ncbi:hypothetical protein EVAR_66837_1 [Eumeta japonica]|uniref:Uncharacterized protein n=1 Tax=Eumeta variegata TaxID=151549 RepID=A0A4C1ZC61_EUMVA|nr:hypothetical protein EVAR_66837_1 [Eumeta japonica]